MDQSEAGDLPVETDAELRREVLALARRWRRLLSRPSAAAEDATCRGVTASCCIRRLYLLRHCLQWHHMVCRRV